MLAYLDNVCYTSSILSMNFRYHSLYFVVVVTCSCIGRVYPTDLSISTFRFSASSASISLHTMSRSMSLAAVNLPLRTEPKTYILASLPYLPTTSLTLLATDLYSDKWFRASLPDLRYCSNIFDHILESFSKGKQLLNFTLLKPSG